MKLFNFLKSDTVLGSEKEVVALTKTTNQLIDEIHETFYTEVDKLLAQAKVSHSLDTDKQELIDKCEVLKKMGFSNTQEVKEAQAEIKRIKELEMANKEKEGIVNAINYFSVKYPNYKFITEESVKAICKKYGIIYGSVERYIGAVPTKNLKHIEDFKIDDSDECYQMVNRRYAMGIGRSKEIAHISKDKMDKAYEHYYTKPNDHTLNFYLPSIGGAIEYCKAPLEIVAPQKDFDMKGMEVVGYQISAIIKDDPIVLKPVLFEDKKYYLIVTAWGLEASDELVVNQKMN